MSIDVDTLYQDVARAKTVVAPSWPLSSTIAVNPLSGFEHLHFDDARRFARALFGARGHLTLREYRDQMSAGRISFEDLRQAQARRFPDVTDNEFTVLLADLLDGDEEVIPDRWAITMVERVDAERGTDLRTQLDIEVADWCARWAVQDGDNGLWCAGAPNSVTASAPSHPIPPRHCSSPSTRSKCRSRSGRGTSNVTLRRCRGGRRTSVGPTSIATTPACSSSWPCV